MRRHVFCGLLFGALSLNGCGGGGSTVPPAASKAITTVYLFGNMTSSSWVASVETAFKVPSGVFTNISTSAGVSSGIIPLYSSAVLSSGPVRMAPSKVTGTYDTQKGILNFNLINDGGLPLRSSTVGYGTEIAKIIYTLPHPGVIPDIPALRAAPNPAEPSEYLRVGQELPGFNVNFVQGCTLNFVTTFQ